MAERSDFHKAFMKPTEDCPSGFFRQGPPHREAAVAVRANRLAAMRSFHPRQELKPGSGWGAEVCAWCWEHGVGATKCRLVGLGMSGPGPGPGHVSYVAFRQLLGADRLEELECSGLRLRVAG